MSEKASSVAGGSSVGSGSVAQAPSSMSAAATPARNLCKRTLAKTVEAGRSAGDGSVRELAHHIQQHFVVGMLAERGIPHLAGFLAPPEHPQHLA